MQVMHWLTEGDGPARFCGMAALGLLSIAGVLRLPPAYEVVYTLPMLLGLDPDRQGQGGVYPLQKKPSLLSRKHLESLQMCYSHICSLQLALVPSLLSCKHPSSSSHLVAVMGARTRHVAAQQASRPLGPTMHT